MSLLAALALALPLAAQGVVAPPCEGGFSQAAADALSLTRAQWDAACAGKPAPEPRRRAVKAHAAAVKPARSGPVARWLVFDASGKTVLRYSDEGGPLRSTALQSKPVSHAFVSGEALDPVSEGTLRAALDASRDAEDFRARLQHAGFLVLPQGAPAPVPPGSSWSVLKGGRLVMTVKNEPGPLFGSAPKAGPAARHRFLSASAFAPEEEDALRGYLETSRSTAEFLQRLEKAGYAVRRAE